MDAATSDTPVRESKIENVLLVDDEPDIRVVAELALGTVGGWNVTTAESGEVALQVLTDERPDLILLDVMMPGLDGPATLEAIRTRPELESIPVIFMTAKVMPAEVGRYLDLGAIGVVAKPFDPMTLPDSIREMVAAPSAGTLVQ